MHVRDPETGFLDRFKRSNLRRLAHTTSSWLTGSISCLDNTNPLSPSEGHQYILMFINRFTRWQFPLLVDPSKRLHKHPLSWDIYFSYSTHNHQDSGAQFQTKLFHNFFSLLDCKRLYNQLPSISQRTSRALSLSS